MGRNKRNTDAILYSLLFLEEKIMSEQDSEKNVIPSVASFTIWVDADACPVALKDIVFRAAKRLQIKTVLVANGHMNIPKSELFRLILVPSGADKADQKIVELLKSNDLVITGDIPLAAAVVEKGATALGTRGELFDEKNIGERLAMRNAMDHFRSAGMETGGPKPLGKKEVQAFANQLDRMLTKLLKK